MKYFVYFLIGFLAIDSLCLAHPVKRQEDAEDMDGNDMERLKRQMKGGGVVGVGSGTTTLSDERAEVKFLGGPMLSPINAASTGALQAFSNNLQNGRPNSILLQGPYGPNLPGFGVGTGGLNGITGQPSLIASGVNVNAPFARYPNGYEMYPPQNIYNNGGFYPNYGGAQQQLGNVMPPVGIAGSFGALENLVDYANLPGLNGPLGGQPFQQPYPLPQGPGGFYPQLGYGPAYQNFQG